jgi:hypothetical protein
MAKTVGWHTEVRWINQVNGVLRMPPGANHVGALVNLPNLPSAGIVHHYVAGFGKADADD